jgi:hypothetical protein
MLFCQMFRYSCLFQSTPTFVHDGTCANDWKLPRAICLTKKTYLSIPLAGRLCRTAGGKDVWQSFLCYIQHVQVHTDMMRHGPACMWRNKLQREGKNLAQLCGDRCRIHTTGQPVRSWQQNKNRKWKQDQSTEDWLPELLWRGPERSYRVASHPGQKYGPLERLLLYPRLLQNFSISNSVTEKGLSIY